MQGPHNSYIITYVIPFKVIINCYMHLIAFLIWCGIPKPCLRLNRLAAGTFALKNHMPFFRKVCFGQELTIFVNILCMFRMFGHTYVHTVPTYILYLRSYVPTYVHSIQSVHTVHTVHTVPYCAVPYRTVPYRIVPVA